MKKLFTILALFSVFSVTHAQSGFISTVAGFSITPNAGYSGDGGQATAAFLNYPQATVFDAAGNMYIADANNNVIRKVTPSGVISTFAGTGIAGYSGDGGKANKAKLHAPYGLAVDKNKNIYVADLANQVIRKIDTTLTISTVIGNGTFGYSGDGGQAINAQLFNPRGVAVDTTGNIYVADTRNQVIRKVTLAGVISTYAGTGSQGYGGDGGAATSALLNYPAGIIFDKVNNLYIADQLNNRVRKVVPGGTITTFAGTGTLGYTGDAGAATSATLDHPTGVGVDSTSRIYIADQGNHVIRRVASGTISTYAGNGTGATTNTGGYSGDGAAATSATLNLPGSISFSPTWNAYISDNKNNVVRKINK